MWSNGRQRSARIIGIGSYLPDRVLSNADLERMVDTSDEWIRERTGIRERRWAEDSVACSDLAIVAARKAIDNAGVDPQSIGAIIVATVTADMIFPCTGCLVQRELGIKNACAFDLSAACSGFLYGLTIGRGYIAGGMCEHVLVIGADIMTRLVDWTDRKTCVLFGDGAGAVVLGPCEEDRGILSAHLGSDGTKADLLSVPSSGSRMPPSHATVDEGLHFVKMSGERVFKVAVRNMEDAARIALEKCGSNASDLDLLIPHQANKRIIEATVDRLGIPMERVFLNVEKYGNMSCASIPVALDEALQEKRLKSGDLLGMVAFGAGLTWGAVVMKW